MTFFQLIANENKLSQFFRLKVLHLFDPSTTLISSMYYIALHKINEKRLMLTNQSDKRKAKMCCDKSDKMTEGA